MYQKDVDVPVPISVDSESKRDSDNDFCTRVTVKVRAGVAMAKSMASSLVSQQLTWSLRLGYDVALASRLHAPKYEITTLWAPKRGATCHFQAFKLCS